MSTSSACELALASGGVYSAHRRVGGHRPLCARSHGIKRRRGAADIGAVSGGRADTTRPPRLVLRVAVTAAVALALAAVVMILYTRRYALERAEEDASAHTSFVARAILPDHLLPSDFAAPVTAARR